MSTELKPGDHDWKTERVRKGWDTDITIECKACGLVENVWDGLAECPGNPYLRDIEQLPRWLLVRMLKEIDGHHEFDGVSGGCHPQPEEHCSKWCQPCRMLRYFDNDLIVEIRRGREW